MTPLFVAPRGQVIDTSDEYQYIINICGQSIDEPCGSSVTNVSDIAGCQKRNDDSSQAHVIGRVSQQTLRSDCDRYGMIGNVGYCMIKVSLT